MKMPVWIAWILATIIACLMVLLGSRGRSYG